MAEGNYQYVIQGCSINAMGGSGKKLKETFVNILIY
jgi:hypothetical protein